MDPFVSHNKQKGSGLRLSRVLRGVIARQQALADVLAVFLTIKVTFYLVALFATWMLPEYGGNEYPVWYTSADRLIDMSWRWDGEWYMSIAREGYFMREGYSNVAFFPLYPLLTSLLGLVLGGDRMLPLAGVLVSNAAFLGALFYLHALATLDEGRGVARRAIWYVAIVPSAIFFHAAYAESLFLLTAAATIYHLRRGGWWAAGLWAALAVLTRSQGVILLLPLAWELGRLWWRERRVPWRNGLTLLQVPLGLSLFMAYLYWRFGDPLAFLHVQSEWSRSFGFPLVSLWQALENVFAGYQDWSYPLETINTAMVLIFLLVALASVRRWPAAYSLYVFGGLTMALIMPVDGSPTQSGARFMIVLFPVLFSLAAWSEKRPALGRLITTVSLPLFGLLTALFVNWYWVV